MSDYYVVDMSWPEGNEALSSDAVEAIELLLTLDPVKRARAPEIRKMGLFTSLLATNIDLLSTTAPFIPQPDDPADTTYFEGKPLQTFVVRWFFFFHKILEY